MKFIGITGGVGAGKSAILDYLSKKDKVRVMLADEIAHKLMEPGSKCYDDICHEFQGEDILDADGSFHRLKLAKVIFSSDEKRNKLNEIVHPAVKEYVIDQYEKEKASNSLDFLILEAALLIEEHYDAICDELWYIYTSEENRRKRLKESRGYSDEKIDNIFSSQLREEEFTKKCKCVIDNNDSLEKTFLQIEKALRGGEYEQRGRDCRSEISTRD